MQPELHPGKHREVQTGRRGRIRRAPQARVGVRVLIIQPPWAVVWMKVDIKWQTHSGCLKISAFILTGAAAEPCHLPGVEAGVIKCSHFKMRDHLSKNVPLSSERKIREGQGTHRRHTGIRGEGSRLSDHYPLSLGPLKSSPSMRSDGKFLGHCPC